MKEPTTEQLKAYWQMSVRASNLLQPINLVRLDERNERIVMLIADTIQIDILTHGELIRELQQINYPILWGGLLARPVHRTG